MIRAIVALNADGYVIRKSLIDLPEDLMECEDMQWLLSDSLVMATMDVVKKYLPEHIAMVSRKSLLAEHPKALATMAANIENQGVGNISVLANEEILEQMDAIGMSYELAVIYPERTQVPTSLFTGKKLIDSRHFDRYVMDRYQQSVTEATDTQIADYINGMETYFNMVDNMDKRDQDAVNKIVKGVRMLNRALQKESTDSNFMGESDDAISGVDEIDTDDEFERVWDAMKMMGDQISETTDLILATQDTLGEVMQFVKNNPVPRSLVTRITMMNDEVDGLRHQFGEHLAESITEKKPRRDPLIWVILGISILALVGTLINLCL